MSGETELTALLQGMSPVLSPRDYVFVSLPGQYGDYSSLSPLASFQESEGLTLILEAETARNAWAAGLLPPPAEPEPPEGQDRRAAAQQSGEAPGPEGSAASEQREPAGLPARENPVNPATPVNHELFRAITLEVHSSLNAVGLTAAVSGALARRGISANVVAAFYHDHIFVPAGQAQEALETLGALSRGDEP